MRIKSSMKTMKKCKTIILNNKNNNQINSSASEIDENYFYIQLEN